MVLDSGGSILVEDIEKESEDKTGKQGTL